MCFSDGGLKPPATYTFILRDGVLMQFDEGTAVATGTNAEPSFELEPPVKS